MYTCYMLQLEYQYFTHTKKNLHELSGYNSLFYIFDSMSFCLFLAFLWICETQLLKVHTTIVILIVMMRVDQKKTLRGGMLHTAKVAGHLIGRMVHAFTPTQ